MYQKNSYAFIKGLNFDRQMETKGRDQKHEQERWRDYGLLTNTAFLTPFSVRNLIGDGKLPKIMIEVKLIRNQNSEKFFTDSGSFQLYFRE